MKGSTIVGVPAFCEWLSGPSVRIFSPTCLNWRRANKPRVQYQGNQQPCCEGLRVRGMLECRRALAFPIHLETLLRTTVCSPSPFHCRYEAFQMDTTRAFDKHPIPWFHRWFQDVPHLFCLRDFTDPVLVGHIPENLLRFHGPPFPRRSTRPGRQHGQFRPLCGVNSRIHRPIPAYLRERQIYGRS